MSDFITTALAVFVGVFIGIGFVSCLVENDLDECEKKFDTAECTILYVPFKSKESIKQYLEETKGGRLNNEQ